MMPSSEFWRDKRVLITGHTGFKGGWLTLWLQRLGAEVGGVALPPNTAPNLFEAARVAAGMNSSFCDIRDASALAGVLRDSRPEVVFHLAAQPLVRAGYREPLATIQTNVLGTANLLEAIRHQPSVRVAVMVTTDKVYRNAEGIYPFRENDPLGGHDPYSASKAASEILIESYRSAFLALQGAAVASARAGNVIGGGDWAEDRLIPDAVRAWQNQETLRIRRPDSVRPWQHVLEPLAGYLALARRLWEKPELASAFNFGPASNESVTVRDLIELSREAYGGGSVHYGDGSGGPHEASRLALDTIKARIELGVSSRWTLKETVTRSIEWYQAYRKGVDARELCMADIAAYESDS